VKDNGKGMDAEFIRERLFRPFDSTKGSKGMGIGAYQTREYVQMLGGRVEVQSSPGQGTSFSISLPLEQVAGTADADRNLPDAAGQRQQAVPNVSSSSEQ
jgi:signal transduction histidine kinase